MDGSPQQNDNWARRGLTDDLSCTVCETEDHLLRECPHAKAIWRTLARRNLHCLYSGTSLHEWIEENVSGSHIDKDWSAKFITTLWYLWKWRNTHCFGNGHEIPEDKGKFLVDRYEELLRALETDVNPLDHTSSDCNAPKIHQSLFAFLSLVFPE